MEARFWAKVSKGDGCWTWTGSRNPKGYGRLNVDGAVRLAHGLSWRIHCGEVPDGLLVLHRCDNPPCVNPEHLFLGTAADNTADMVSKGRDCRALSDEQRATVVERYRSLEMNQVELARAFGVSQAAIWKVLHNAGVTSLRSQRQRRTT